MNVTEIIAEDGFERKTTFVVAPNLELIAPGSEKAVTLDMINAMVGRRYRVSIVRRSYASRQSGEYYAKTRVYVYLPDRVLPDSPPASVKGEDPENDRAWRAHNRLEIAAMRTLLNAFRPLILALTFGESDPKASFSMKAGCNMCPCSPGFILGSQTRRFQEVPCDVWIEEVPTGRTVTRDDPEYHAVPTAHDVR